MLDILLGIVLGSVWFWIYLEVENAPLYKQKTDEFVYKDYFTVFGIKLFKNPRKNK